MTHFLIFCFSFVPELKEKICNCNAGGIEKGLRAKLWPLLFGVFPCSFTAIEREASLAQQETRFVAIQEKWRSWLVAEFPTFDFSKPDNYIVDDHPYHQLPNATFYQPVETVAKNAADSILLVEAKVS